jgi:hypothetical protein
MRQAKGISHSSFFPCVFEAMDRLPPKITLISPSDPHCRDRLSDVRLDWVLGPLVLVVASSCDSKKFCTLPDCVQRYDGSRITSLRQ